MDLLLYIPKMKGAGEKLVLIIEALFPDGTLEFFRTFRQLTSRLRQPVNDREVMVLYLPTRRLLDEIMEIAPLLERLRLIAILPDVDPETIAQGHRLRPRYLTTVDQRFEDVAAVLTKIGKVSGAPLETCLNHLRS
jgi:hypothetical protein